MIGDKVEREKEVQFRKLFPSRLSALLFIDAAHFESR